MSSSLFCLANVTQTDRPRARAAGATQTFRRPSAASSLSQQRENGQINSTTPNTAVYVPPHLNSNYQSSQNRNAPATDSRYSKDQLLDFFRANGEGSFHNKIVSDLFVGDWTPGPSSATTNDSWNRRDDHKDGNYGPEICWDYDGSTHPLGLVEMDEDEKQVRSAFSYFR